MKNESCCEGSRRGVTLTEILIGILLLGIGMISILTLFPLGMLNARAATRYTRSAFLVESATADLSTRNLLNKFSFKNIVTGQYYYDSAYTPWPYDPWVQDTPSYGADPIVGPTFGAYRGKGSFNPYSPPPHNKSVTDANGFAPGQGLPVAYDPLWRTAANYFPGKPFEARFASGIGFIRNDPTPGSGPGSSAVPSAHGLQRITNFPDDTRVRVNVPDIFVSPEDVVLQSESDVAKGASPIVPDMNMVPLSSTPNGIPITTNDWKYTWMFTGQQSDATNGTVFNGDIVVFENRPFAVETVAAPFSAAVTTAVSGETVVEAIFGYTGKVTSAGGTVGYGSTASRAVLLRWSDQLPDPEIKVGNWIADVTYERISSVDYKRSYTDPNTGSAGAFYPYQRCHWYQIAKRTDVAASSTLTGFREMTVWTSTPLKALTLLNNGGAANGTPVHVNAALVSPYVVNVFPRTIYTR